MGMGSCAPKRCSPRDCFYHSSLATVIVRSSMFLFCSIISSRASSKSCVHVVKLNFDQKNILYPIVPFSSSWHESVDKLVPAHHLIGNRWFRKGSFWGSQDLYTGSPSGCFRAARAVTAPQVVQQMDSAVCDASLLGLRELRRCPQLP